MILLLFACLTAYPDFRLELSLSSHGRRSAIGLTAKSGILLTAAHAPAIARMMLPDRRPGIGSLLVDRLRLLHWVALAALAAAPARETARPTAQMKPANSRATAVTARFLGFPFLSNAR